MKIIRKIRAFLGLNRTMKRLLIEAFISLARARYLKSIPFSKVAPSLGNKMEETTYTPDSSNKEILRDVSKAIHIISPYTFGKLNALSRL